MAQYPLQLTDYPNRDSALPLHINIHRLKQGYPPHRHDFLEFSYVTEGQGSEWINGVRHPMQPGTFSLILPYQIHEIETGPGQTLELVNCMFGLDLLMGTSSHEGLGRLLAEDASLSPHLQMTGRVHERLLLLLRQMLEEYERSDDWRGAMLRAKLTEVLIVFDRERRSVQHRPEEASTNLVTANPIWRVLHYIQRHHQEPLTLSILSERFAISMSRISERIKEATGLSFMQLLSELRIRHACSLLASTGMNVSEVCYEVGFGSYKTFVRLFRDRVGMSPTAYRKQRLAAATLPSYG